MVKLMPQELQVRYLLPAIRKELAKVLIKNYEMKQKDVASVLGMTDAAISQYLSSKRGSEIIFSKEEKKIISEYAKLINENKNDGHELMYKVSQKLRCTEALCKLHKKLEKVPTKCDLCK